MALEFCHQLSQMSLIGTKALCNVQIVTGQTKRIGVNKSKLIK